MRAQATHRSGTRGGAARALQAVVAALLFALAATGGAAQFKFAAFGDTPYSAAEERQFVSMIEEMNRRPLALAIHVGDFKSASAECSDALFAQRREWFGLSEHPFVFVPGDNEWTDCGRAQVAYAPLERLARLREFFFADDSTLGRSALRVERQAARGYPEHLRWTSHQALFVTLNVPGPDNNARLMPQESQQRTAAVLEWVRDAFRVARVARLPALVLVMHANPWTGRRGFQVLLDALADEAPRYAGEILVVHGDTHRYRFDRPLTDRHSGRRIANLTRLEVSGSPFADWIEVTVEVRAGRARFSAVPGSQAGAQSLGAEP